MNFAHTFWSKPLRNNKFFDFKSAVELTMHTYNMSADMVKCYGHNITLYTDYYGAELLGFIQYDNIVVIDIDESESVHFAAQMKIKALEQMDLEDTLIDGDLFLWKSEAYDVLANIKADVVFSLYEDNEYVTSIPKYKDRYEEMLKTFNSVDLKPPYNIQSIEDLGWPNTSLLRFNNQEAKDHYIEQYKHHKSLFQQIDFKESWPDIFIEQKFLELMCKHYNYTYKPIIEDFRNNEEYAKKIGFMHLGGGKKRFLHYATDWLKDNDPQRYNYTVETIKHIKI